MIDKIEMTVTVNPLVSPRLYRRLRECDSPRERAIVFRALAEARLWDEALGNAHPVERGTTDRRDSPVPQVSVGHEPPVPQYAAPPQTAAMRAHVAASRSPNTPSTRGSELEGSSDALQIGRTAGSDDSGSAYGDALSSDFAQFD